MGLGAKIRPRTMSGGYSRKGWAGGARESIMTGKQVSAGKQQPVLRGEWGIRWGRASEDEGQSWWAELKSLRRRGQSKRV